LNLPNQFSTFLFLFVLNQNQSLCNSKSNLSSFLFLFVPPSKQNPCVSFLQLESEPIFWWKSNLNPVLGDNSMQIQSATQAMDCTVEFRRCECGENV
ncbi:hypothetical protein LINPERPRIM_LOCUS1999, partial [Linum perenne]